MKDCGYTLRKAYYDKLIASSYSLNAYDTIAPDTVEPPFLLISSQSAVENSNKQNFANNVNIQFDIVYKTNKIGEVGQKSVDTWANELLEIIATYPPDYIDLSPNFSMVTRKITNNQATFDFTNDAYIFRRVIIFQHFVAQLT